MTEDIPVVKTYEAEFTMIIPGNQKASVHKISVEALDPIEATARAIDEWNARTEPCDVRVREVKKTPAANQ